MEVGNITTTAIGGLSSIPKSLSKALKPSHPKGDIIAIDFSRKEMDFTRVTYQRVLKSTRTKGGGLKERIREQALKLYSTDPKLAENYLTIVEFLNKYAPESLPKFVDMIDHLIEQKEAKPQVKPSIDLKLEFHYKLDANIIYKNREKEIKLSYHKAIDFKLRLRIGVKPVIKKIDPLVIDMNGNGIKLTHADNGALFDIDGDGEEEKVSFIQGDDAFLFIDRNFNNLLDNGTELIGTNPAFKNGFEELKLYDANHDNKIDAKDPIYRLLRIFRDFNGDKKVSPKETKTLQQAGIRSIILKYKEVQASYQSLTKTNDLLAYSSYKTDKKSLFIGDYNISFKERA
ncbi:MAG: hypothetical protein J7L41_01970 [Synergistetes bacterium]|nr:hypothetical protein [Synergistota bacterium]